MNKRQFVETIPKIPKPVYLRIHSDHWQDGDFINALENRRFYPMCSLEQIAEGVVTIPSAVSNYGIYDLPHQRTGDFIAATKLVLSLCRVVWQRTNKWPKIIANAYEVSPPSLVDQLTLAGLYHAFTRRRTGKQVVATPQTLYKAGQPYPNNQPPDPDGASDFPSPECYWTPRQDVMDTQLQLTIDVNPAYEPIVPWISIRGSGTDPNTGGHRWPHPDLKESHWMDLGRRWAGKLGNRTAWGMCAMAVHYDDRDSPSYPYYTDFDDPSTRAAWLAFAKGATE